MKEQVTCPGRGENCALDEADLDRIEEVLRAGGLVVYPTDTLYALGCDPTSHDAVQRLLAVKGRPGGTPISVAVSSLEDAEGLVRLNPLARALAGEFLPGPLTLVLESGGVLPGTVLGEGGTLGLRIPGHHLALQLAARVGSVTATSANRHGEADPASLKEAYEQLGDDVDIYADCPAGPPGPGVPSTVVRVLEDGINIIREGAIYAPALDGFVRNWREEVL